MATQFIFNLEDKPGSLAQVTETLGNAGVNVDGIAGISANGKGAIRLVTNNAESAEAALTSSGVSFEKNEVLLVKLEDKPGQIAKLSRAIADEGINFDAFYVTMSGQQVVSTDNLARTKEIASDLGVL